MTKRHSVTVEVAGESHILRTDVSPEYTRQVAAYLDEMARRHSSPDAFESRRAVLLAALAVTDELFRARARVERLRAELEARTRELTARIETSLEAADDDG